MLGTSTAIYLASLRQITGVWRRLIVIALSGLPGFFSIIAGNSGVSTEEFVEAVIEGLSISLIVPLVTLMVAAPLFADEIDDRTLANLTLSPIPRWQIVLPKLLSAVTVASVPIFIGVFAAAVIGVPDDHFSFGLAIAAGSLIGIVCYGSLFAFVGTITTRAIVFGLVYAFIWETILASIAPGLRYVSVKMQVLSITNALDTDVVLTSTLPELPYAIIAATVVTIGCAALCVWRLRTMDVS